jgi:hypothetical protein
MAGYTAHQIIMVDESAANERTMDRRYGCKRDGYPVGEIIEKEVEVRSSRRRSKRGRREGDRSEVIGKEVEAVEYSPCYLYQWLSL